MSEHGYMHRRVQVEWRGSSPLSDAGFAEFKPLTTGARAYLLSLVKNFSEADSAAIKEIEKTTNHDVKAVEYWIKSKFEARPELEQGRRICALCLHQRRHQQHQPRAATALGPRPGHPAGPGPHHDKLRNWRITSTPTCHAQPHPWPTASPTTVGKGLANVVAPPRGAVEAYCGRENPMGKMNGCRKQIPITPTLAAWPDSTGNAHSRRGRNR